ncbi:hypothetical protein AMAG_09979 [Allomyces macrogynus ATCC 38327]|uniref:RRM domain-containing protein n=1 Tax=Allomyces macrogynus (strain ATCC 38327) TaxID=578462 RepID=A0A0L0SQH2_ALLM3|nr:hypothetical protein AMAG_09979 [Allomyces macrogynus ATCC 38327]|eukprot:KNE64624.1 hypothetical protein AMAG_09979 [Allomyces macrogynus ATCC 38327]
MSAPNHTATASAASAAAGPPAPITRPPDANNLHLDPRVFLHAVTRRPCYRDDDDVEWEFLAESRSWFPVVNEDAVQHAYGNDAEIATVVPPSVKRKAQKELVQGEKAEKRRKESAPKPVTSIYVSQLPKDVTVDELRTEFSKYGIIMEDLATNLPKIKIYTDANGDPKGDALITYFKEESVQLAIELMDESRLRADDPNSVVRVSKAQFREKTEEELAAARTKKLALDKKTKVRKMAKIDRKLDWNDDAPNEKKLARLAKVVVLKHMFTLDELAKDPALMLDIKEDIREECERVGEVTSIILYDAEPEGILVVRFKEELSAQACIKLMNGRFYAGQQVVAEIHDGRKYRRSKANDTEEERERLEAYEKWLEEGK